LILRAVEARAGRPRRRHVGLELRNAGRRRVRAMCLRYLNNYRRLGQKFASRDLSRLSCRAWIRSSSLGFCVPFPDVGQAELSEAVYLLASALSIARMVFAGMRPKYIVSFRWMQSAYEGPKMRVIELLL
jgi:hypothetical protein